MSATVTYKGETIATVDNETKVLQTAGTYCEDNITITASGGGGGSTKLYIFSDATFLNIDATAGNTFFSPRSAFSSPEIVEGATITVYTYSSYILDTITGETSGDTIPYTTVQRGRYTFVMPGESVYCALYYDD